LSFVKIYLQEIKGQITSRIFIVYVPLSIKIDDRDVRDMVPIHSNIPMILASQRTAMIHSQFL
jgi:hypothetical protein